MSDADRISDLENTVAELTEQVETLSKAISRYGFTAPEIQAPEIPIIDRLSALEDAQPE